MKDESVENELLEIAKMCKESTNYYLKVFQNVKSTKFIISWNWASFFLGPIWLGYRKIYPLFFIVLIGNSLLTAFSFYKDFYNYLDILFIFENLLLALFGNVLYFNDLSKKINYNAQEQNSKKKFGGVNNKIFVISFGIYELIILLIINIKT